MHAERARTVKRQIASLCHSGRDTVSLVTECERLLRTVIPFDRSCWHTVDPSTMMLTSVIGDSAPTSPVLPLVEYGTTEVNRYAELARAKTPVAALRQVTNDAPESLQRYQEVLRPMAIEDELTATFVIDSACWGCARFYRSGRWPAFDAVEVAYVASLSMTLAEGFRSSLLTPHAMILDTFDGPGVLVLDKRGRLESITPSAEHWLREIVDVVPAEGELLPLLVYAVAARAQAIASGSESAPSMARARIPTRSGGWLVLHAATLVGRSDESIAVVVEPAPAIEMAPLIMNAYGLTEREREVTGFALQGLATKQIALELGISAYTVSDHLKAVFEKVSVGSRTELASRIFLDQYWPRIGRGTIETNGWLTDAF